MILENEIKLLSKKAAKNNLFQYRNFVQTRQMGKKNTFFEIEKKYIFQCF